MLDLGPPPPPTPVLGAHERDIAAARREMERLTSLESANHVIASVAGSSPVQGAAATPFVGAPARASGICESTRHGTSTLGARWPSAGERTHATPGEHSWALRSARVSRHSSALQYGAKPGRGANGKGSGTRPARHTPWRGSSAAPAGLILREACHQAALPLEG